MLMRGVFSLAKCMLPRGERESGSYSGTRQRNRFFGPAPLPGGKLVGVTQKDPETPSGDPGRVVCSA